MPDGSLRAAASEPAAETAPKKRRKAWLQQLHQWHWISSAVCLIGMLLFSITGITLNHAGQIEAAPSTVRETDRLPTALLTTLSGANGQPHVPADVADWLSERLSVRLQDRALDWSHEELYIALPRPGGDAWISIDLGGGGVEYERTDRGWISHFNDLHKGRDTGVVWGGFIDVFAVASVVFCVTGLLLLQLHSRHRPATWPTVGLGLAVMLVITLVFIH
jgi:uncharacterized protein